MGETMVVDSIRSPNVPPGLFSVQRLTMLIASLIVGLCSGTNYVYSAYAPQLGSRLQITHTQLNIVGLAGNVGVYSSGPIWGRIVDTRGPRILLASSFLLLLAGYSGIYNFYSKGLSPSETTLSGLSFALLVSCAFITGSGGNAGLTSAVNSTAKTFPDSARASTVGLVVSGFGLSAFLFSTVARIVFPGDTASFLLLLSLGTAFPMIMGFFLVRPIPLPPSTRKHQGMIKSHANKRGAMGLDIEEGEAGGSAGASDSQTPLLKYDDLEGRQGVVYVADVDVEGEHEAERERLVGGADDYPPLDGEQEEGRLIMSGTESLGMHRRHLSRRRALLLGDVGLTNVFGKGLIRSRDFWLLFTILSLLSGTGLMYINNVGSMSQALYAKANPVYDDVQASKWQATQVSSISVMNFAGRIFIGLVCDFGKNRLDLPRSYSVVLVSFFFFISQVTAARVESVENLWIASALLGLAHGSAFSLFPTMCLEWFGMSHFSENWGYLSMSPMFAGNLFSVVFGRNLDAHESNSQDESQGQRRLLTRLFGARVGGLGLGKRGGSGPRCLSGRECYVDTLYLTIGACFLSMLLSVWAGWRDREKMKKALAVASGEADEAAD
ncbi:hypothetical protein AX17_004836 [Amanita inopinata Kibby_2008]|nr:hypothetical protein AX17_004836 [Amanita inopinata Kibby_2008]